jgi:hypothetical protein
MKNQRLGPKAVQVQPAVVVTETDALPPLCPKDWEVGEME